MTTIVDVKRQQGNCFKLLAACFYEPDREMFLQERLCDNLISLLSACGCSTAADAARGMLVALSENSDEELKIEHARLFVGPFELLAPPYGSVHLENKRRIMGDSTMAVKKVYQDAGLNLEEKEAPDHIAFELEFMHFLCLKEAEAAVKDNNLLVHELAQKQSQFFNALLAPWITDFCSVIRNGCENGFYTALADCLEAFILHESNSLAMIESDGVKSNAFHAAV
jgi:TorA maturation chaperone TorD